MPEKQTIPEVDPVVPSIHTEVRRSKRIQEKESRMGKRSWDPEVIGSEDGESDPDYQC